MGIDPAVSTSEVGAELHLADATELAHALCARIGQRESVRVLSIKGPIANLHAIRRNHAAADTDVLVDPARVDVFCHGLEAHGWRKWVGRDTPSLLPTHAWTYTHPRWPGAIDVHSRYPGFFSNPVDVFDELWADRVVVSVANSHVIAPSRPASAVIGALHAARHPNSARHRAEMEQIVELLTGAFTVAEKDAFYRLARVGRALEVLQAPIVQSGLGPLVNDLEADERRRWRLMTGLDDGSSALGWVLALRASPLWRAPILVFRALWVRRRDVPRTNPDVLPTLVETWRYRRTRWARGGKLFVRFLKLRGDA